MIKLHTPCEKSVRLDHQLIRVRGDEETIDIIPANKARAVCVGPTGVGAPDLDFAADILKDLVVVAAGLVSERGRIGRPVKRDAAGIAAVAPDHVEDGGAVGMAPELQHPIVRSLVELFRSRSIDSVSGELVSMCCR
jgi:hypothetical protein